MKRQTRHHIASALAIVIAVTFAISSCEDSGTNTIVDGDDQVTANSHFSGKWYQIPFNGDEKMERTLDFSDGLGTIIYPDRTGQCAGKPELLKRFSWQEIGEGSNILKLNVVFHAECGVESEGTYEEIVSYSTGTNNTLHIFSHDWVR